MDTSQVAFFVLVAAVAVQRLLELRVSRQHEAALKARGGREHGAEQMKWMTLLHGSWLVAMPLEVLVFERAFVMELAVPALALLIAGQVLRYAAIRTLGDRWCVKVITVPSEPVVNRGIFRHIRHPNYLGVAFEIGALPLVHGAWLTALVASCLNVLLLKRRIQVEEAALSADENYTLAFTR